MTNFLIKIILASALISFLIKYGGPLLPIPTNNMSALIFILLPPLIVALVLWKQMQSEQRSL